MITIGPAAARCPDASPLVCAVRRARLCGDWDDWVIGISVRMSWSSGAKKN